MSSISAPPSVSTWSSGREATTATPRGPECGSRLEGGSDVSFNNLLDANAAFELVKEFDKPAAVIVKHLNPCGCATDDDIRTAYRKAYEGDVISAFGGIIALNRKVDIELAQMIMESYSRFGKALGASGFFAEVIIAPEFEPDSIEIMRTLKSWGSRVRLVETGPISKTQFDTEEYDVRHIVGGMLLQKRDHPWPSPASWACGP